MRAKYGDSILILANPNSIRVFDSYTWIYILKVMEEVDSEIVVQDSWNGLLIRSLVQAQTFICEYWSLWGHFSISLLGNPEPYTAGGAQCSSIGESHMGFTIALGPTGCNSLAEATGILYGLKLVRSLGFSDIQVQSDSLLLDQLLIGKARTTWALDRLIQEILQSLPSSLVTQLHAQIIQVYREANQVADALTNFGCDLKGEVIFHSLDQLSPQICEACILDSTGRLICRRPIT
ncbi:hypothetical protein M9H77_08198 [Catharanthus roseus]|uniref:Uncharacterized protein n=1 Tax=Catharanthus roseus TaxID=4058 RepID=A0ACC0BXI1_CATRO|nr:hypothetical protein M9H77_08198 [Catharanthus roseus]